MVMPTAAPGPRASGLTARARGGGCGCKLGRSVLLEALELMPEITDPRVLVGFDAADDAAVHRVSDDLCVVASVDFATPIVDDLAVFGAIAAVNALSDLHAMGATPLMALAVAAFPADAAPRDLGTIMAGAARAALDDGCPVLGGHTISDPEPKYGLAVVGTAHPGRLLRNDAARPDDTLLLTKPLGTGVIATAEKAGRGVAGAMDAAVAVMLTSNREASRAALAAGLRCATDVTGFGLAGHLTEMAAAGGGGAEIDADAVPLLPGARALADAGVTTGGARRNRAHADALVDADDDVDPVLLDLLHDPQTSGGLLLAAPADLLPGLRRELDARGVTHWRVERITGGPPGRVAVRA